MYINMPFLGMHHLTYLPGKDKRGKKKTAMRKKKRTTTSTIAACVSVSLSTSYENTFSKF